MAIRSPSNEWYLVNASPDLPRQIEAFPELHPQASPARNSPIAGVLLTNSDLDHTLGLFSLREGNPVNLFAPAAVRSVLAGSLGLDRVLGSFCGVHWREPATGDFAPLSMQHPSLQYRAIHLGGTPPRFATESKATGPHSVAYEFLDTATEGRLLVAPDVATVTEPLLEALKSSDAILFDGTFWSPEELKQVRPGAANAGEMGHLTIRESSLKLLTGLRARHKIYLHINNTNPILNSGSSERAEVEAAGLVVGYDGLEFAL